MPENLDSPVMLSPPATSDPTISEPAALGVDPGRRWFGGLLALLGGGAALSACSEAEGAHALGTVAQGVTATDLQWFDSIAAMRNFDNTGSAYGFAVLLGYSVRGDGGGGLFCWKPPLSGLVDDDGITIIATSATDGGTITAGYWLRIFSGPINVKWFGAKGDITTDDTARIQAAINSSGGGNRSTAASNFNDPGFTRVYFPHGTYLVTSTLTVSHERTHLVGDGVFATAIKFEPTATVRTPAVRFSYGSGVLNDCSLSNMAFISADNSHDKVAIELSDVSSFLLENVRIFQWTSGPTFSTMSTGIVVMGREHSTLRNLDISADRPISIEPNANAPGASEDLDSFHMQNLSLAVLGTDANASGIFFKPGVAALNLSIDNTNLSGGRYGIYWHDTLTTTLTSRNITIRNLRSENLIQPSETTGGQTIHISTFNLSSLLIDNVYCGFASSGSAGHKNRGFYFRNAAGVTIDNCQFQSIDTSTVPDDPMIDIDATCSPFMWRNCVFAQFGRIATGTLSRMRDEQSYALWTPPHTAFYMKSSQTFMDLTWRERDSYVNRYSGTLGVGASFDIQGPTTLGARIGTVTAHSYDTTLAVQSAGTASFMQTSTTHAIEKTSGTTNFGVTGSPALLVSWVTVGSTYFLRVTNNFTNPADYVVGIEFRD